MVLYGADYWKGLIEWLRGTVLADGKIAAPDLDLMLLTDDVDRIVEYIVASAQERSEQESAEERAVTGLSDDVRGNGS